MTYSSGRSNNGTALVLPIDIALAKGNELIRNTLKGERLEFIGHERLK